MESLVKTKSITKDVTTAGTSEALVASDTMVISYMILAKAGNVGNIFFGGSDVTSSNGLPIAPGKSISNELPSNSSMGGLEFNLKDVYIDSANDGDGVHITYNYRD